MTFIDASVRAPVVLQAARPHRHGGRDARARDRRHDHRLQRRPRRDAEAAALCRRRPHRERLPPAAHGPRPGLGPIPRRGRLLDSPERRARLGGVGAGLRRHRRVPDEHADVQDWRRARDAADRHGDIRRLQGARRAATPRRGADGRGRPAWRARARRSESRVLAEPLRRRPGRRRSRDGVGRDVLHHCRRHAAGIRVSGRQRGPVDWPSTTAAVPSRVARRGSSRRSAG